MLCWAAFPSGPTVLLALLAASCQAAEPRLPFPQHVRYASGGLRPGQHTQAQQDGDVLAAYQSWKSRYLQQAGTEPDGHPRYRVRLSTDPGAATVSDGQGYGMLIAVHFLDPVRLFADGFETGDASAWSSSN